MTQTLSPTQRLPATLDLALFELRVTLETFSDSDFDTTWMHLSEAEIHQVALVLIQDLKTNLNGKQMAGALLRVRNGLDLNLDGLKPESSSTQSQP